MKVKKAWFLGEDGEKRRLPELEGKEMDFHTMYPIIQCSTIEHVGLLNGKKRNKDEEEIDSVDMWCDEEGLFKDMPTLNHKATELYRAAHPHIDPKELAIVGNVIITDNTKAGDFIKV